MGLIKTRSDAELLDWLLSREAYVGWNRDREMCRVFRYDDVGCEYAPVCGWKKWFPTGREAIDAAINKETA